VPKYKVTFTEKSLDDLNDLSDAEFKRIHKACRRLKDNPVPDGKHIKKLSGYKDLYRLRTGDYRVVFEWKKDTVTVIRVLIKPAFEKRY
jgi:mRNA interferase RelE/StbE